MNRRLYAVKSEKRGVLYIGDDIEKKYEVVSKIDEEGSHYLIERGHDRLLIREDRSKRNVDGQNCHIINVINFTDESLIQALKGLL